MMKVLLAFLFVPAVLGQQCLPGDDAGPCGVGGVCDVGQICITDTPDGTFVCCPFADVVTTTSTAAPTTTTTSSSSGSCVDKLNPQTGRSDCPNVAYLCTDPVYKQVMQDQCPKTCGFCGTGANTGGTACKDKLNPQTGMSDCPNVAYLCNNSAYRDLMKDQCPKTCGYCT